MAEQTEQGTATGRPSLFSEELANDICSRISDGESLNRITQEEGMPARFTVHRWLNENKDFSDKYMRAREIQADVYADEMDDIAHSDIDVNKARLIIDTRKWVASKLKPRKYGDKIDHTTNGKDLPQPIFGGLAVNPDNSSQE